MAKSGPAYPLVSIIWEDATSTTDAWTAIVDIEGIECVHTVGWLIRDEAKYIVVAGSVAAEGESATVNSIVTIPRGMIKTFRKVRLSDVKPRNVRSKLHSEPSAEEVHREQG